MKDGLNFKMKDGKVEISTNQLVDVDEFAKRIASIEAKKTNFKLQIQFMEEQIEDNKKNIEIQKNNIEVADEDLGDAYQFLHSNHREDIVLKIEKTIKEAEEKAKAEMEKQMAMQQQQ